MRKQPLQRWAAALAALLTAWGAGAASAGEAAVVRITDQVVRGQSPYGPVQQTGLFHNCPDPACPTCAPESCYEGYACTSDVCLSGSSANSCNTACGGHECCIIGWLKHCFENCHERKMCILERLGVAPCHCGSAYDYECDPSHFYELQADGSFRFNEAKYRAHRERCRRARMARGERSRRFNEDGSLKTWIERAHAHEERIRIREERVAAGDTFRQRAGLRMSRSLFNYFIPRGCCGKGCPPCGHYTIVYPVDPWYGDCRDKGIYAAEGMAGPVSVPLAPVIRHTFNYGWGVPSSRLTPISHLAQAPNYAYGTAPWAYGTPPAYGPAGPYGHPHPHAHHHHDHAEEPWTPTDAD
jgi:hypothetical protein